RGGRPTEPLAEVAPPKELERYLQFVCPLLCPLFSSRSSPPPAKSSETTQPSFAQVVSSSPTVQTSKLSTQNPPSTSSEPILLPPPPPWPRSPHLPLIVSMPVDVSTSLKSKLLSFLVGFFQPKRDDFRSIERWRQRLWNRPDLSCRRLPSGAILFDFRGECLEGSKLS
ncbi:hypothetical protein AMTR_s00169p00038870, partial [Amborella trichopoda]